MSAKRYPMSVMPRGFTLPEMVLAMAITSILFLAAARMLPALHQHTLRSGLTLQLHEELQQVIAGVEKAVRRVGYCASSCTAAVSLIAREQCLLLQINDSASLVAAGEQGNYLGFRLREGNIETQRNISQCEGSGWEKINDPGIIAIDRFSARRQQQQVHLVIAGHLRSFPFVRLHIERLITGNNL